MAGIAGWGVSIPVWRLDRGMLARAWDTPALPGERAAASGDQDALTLGVEAALECMRGRDASTIDAIYFATTTPPYAEKHAAATIAAVLDLHDVMTVDVTGTLRAGTTALRTGLDAVRSGSARAALVVAADTRPAEPSTAMEQLFGDAAAAILITQDAPITVIGEASVAEEFTGPWRMTGQHYVHSFDGKIETESYARAVERAVTAALADAAVSPDAVARFAAYAPDPRTYATTAKRIGFAQAKERLFSTAGNLGAAHAIVSLAGALDETAPGEHLVVAAQGEGADALVLVAGAGIDRARQAWTLQRALETKRILPGYERYLRFRRLLPVDEENEPPSSTIRTWRDRAQAFALYGVRCGACGLVQFPANRACIGCSALDQMQRVRLQRTGAVFTFTLDHLIAGEYLETPVPRAVVDLNAGGRIFVEVTDCEPSEVSVGMPVELTFRLMHEGAGFKNYYWKARPRRDV
ncbi:MAG: OB-fold domain-containing protein [Actinomycetota bacterium]